MNEEDLKTTLSRVADRAQQDPAALDRITTGRHRREVRRRTMTATGAVATVVALAFAATQLLPRGADDPGSFATDVPGPGTPTAEPGDPSGDPYAAWSFAYIDGQGQVQTVDARGGEAVGTFGWDSGRARFVDLLVEHGFDLGWFHAVVTSDTGDSLVVARDASCANEGCLDELQLASVNGSIDAIGWRTQESFGYLARSEAPEQHVLWFDPYEGEPVRLWTFPEYLGRGISSDDELHVEFSPDGSKVLVVNTFVDTAQERQDETLLVFDLDGNQVVPARNGTHARWSASGTIFYMPVDPNDDTWRELNVDTGEETELPIALPNATNPALSPDGRSLAIENEGSNSITILDLEDGSTEIMPGAAPLWFDTDTLLVTELEECEPDLCEVLPWSDTGRVMKIDVGEIVGEPFPMSTTRGASGLYTHWGS